MAGASHARRTLRRQISLVLGALAVAWLSLVAFFAVPVLTHASASQRAVSIAAVLAVGLLAWLVGIRAVDQLIGPTVDRLAQVAQATAPLDPYTGQPLPDLVSESPRAALRQLAGRMEEAQTQLRARVLELEAVNQKLAGAQEDLIRAERLAVVGKLAAGVAHEVGNPLGALIGFAGVAQASSDPAVAKEAIQGIQVQAERIHRTLQELMDFARAGRMELRAVPLPSAIAAASRLVQAHPRWREMRLTVDLPPDVPTIRASEHHLVQVLVNLLLNAADACDGRGQVTIAAVAAGSGLLVAVSDDGPGIPPAEAEHIFEPFVTTKPMGAGTGLGLAISRQLVERFGGTLQAVPSPRGARFELALVVG